MYGKWHKEPFSLREYDKITDYVPTGAISTEEGRDFMKLLNIYIYSYIFIYTPIYLYILIYIYIHSYILIYTHTYSYILIHLIHTHNHSHILINVSTHTHTYKYTYTRIYLNVYLYILKVKNFWSFSIPLSTASWAKLTTMTTTLSLRSGCVLSRTIQA